MLKNLTCSKPLTAGGVSDDLPSCIVKGYVANKNFKRVYADLAEFKKMVSCQADVYVADGLTGNSMIKSDRDFFSVMEWLKK